MSPTAKARRHPYSSGAVIIEFGDLPWPLAVERTGKARTYVLSVRREGDWLEAVAEFVTDDRGRIADTDLMEADFRPELVQKWIELAADRLRKGGDDARR